MKYCLCFSIIFSLLSVPQSTVEAASAQISQKAPAQFKSRTTRIADNESSAIRSLKAIHAAEVTYQATTGNGRFGSWEALVKSGLLIRDLADKKRKGYRFRLQIDRRSSSSGPLLIVARPQVFDGSGRRSFSIDEQGVVRSSPRRNAPAATMPVLNDEGGGIAEHETSAIATLRTISVAEAVFQSTTGNGNYGNLKELIREQLIHPGLSNGIKNGYLFKVAREQGSSESPPAFAAFAIPLRYGKSGRRSFYIDESGVIRGGDKKGFEANAKDKPLSK